MTSKSNIFDYFLTLFFLILTSKSTFIAESDILWGAFILISLSYSFYMGRVFKEDLLVFLYFSIGYLTLILVRNYTINFLPSSYLISDVFYLLKYILLSYAFCLALKERLFYLFSTGVYHLTIVSLILYPIQILGGGDLLFAIGKTVIRLLPPVSDASDTYSNFIIFTYDRMHSSRNSGFAWEPGAFGCFLIFAIYFHLLENKFTLDKRFIIFSVALATTLSTTAFLAFFIFSFFIYRQKGGAWNIGLIALFTIAILAFIYLPFLGDKIIQTYKEDLIILDDLESINNDLEYYFENGGELRLNRFASGIFLFRHFEEQLILGVSNDYDNLPSTVYEVEINRFNLSNSIFDFMAKFGLIGLLFLLYKVGKLAFLSFGSFEASLYQILIFLSLGFGEPIFTLPLGLIFLFIPSLCMDFEEEDEEEFTG